jgi:hypothetical protein
MVVNSSQAEILPLSKSVTNLTNKTPTPNIVKKVKNLLAKSKGNLTSRQSSNHNHFKTKILATGPSPSTSRVGSAVGIASGAKTSLSNVKLVKGATLLKGNKHVRHYTSTGNLANIVFNGANTVGDQTFKSLSFKVVHSPKKSLGGTSEI